jgi:hypothetical protein
LSCIGGPQANGPAEIRPHGVSSGGGQMERKGIYWTNVFLEDVQ